MPTDRKPLIPYGWVRAITAFVAFLIVFTAFSLAIRAVLHGHSAASGEGQSSQGDLLGAVITVNLSFLFTVYLFRKLVDRRPFISLGLRWSRSDAWMGFLTSIGIIGGGTLVLWGLGNLRFSAVTFDAGSVALNVLIFLIVAGGEELFFRGYMLSNLLQSMNKWMALGISALFFAIVHIQNPGALSSFVVVLSVLAGSLLFGINYIYTRNLWFSLCLHFFWNFLQGPVLGYEVTGTESRSIVRHDITGSPFLTGGAFGFEGSVLCIILSLMAMTVLVLILRARSPEASERAALQEPRA